MGIRLVCIDENGNFHTFEYDDDVTEIQLNDLRLEHVDLEPLTDCTDLERLDLNRNTIWEIDLTPLARCSNLISLGLGINILGRISLQPVSKCKQLEELDLSFNRLDELSLAPLSHLQNLSRLDLSYNRLKIIDLSPLGRCSELEELDLSYNYLEQIDLSPLSSCGKLKSAYLHQKTLKAIDLRHLRFCEHLNDVAIFHSIRYTMRSPFHVFSDTGKDHLVSPATNMIDLSFLVLNPSFVGVLGRLVKRGFRPPGLVVSLFSKSTLESIRLDETASDGHDTLYQAMHSFRDMRTDIPAPISDLEVIRRLSPIVRRREPLWKLHHLVQCALSVYGMSWVGLIDSDPRNILDLIEVGCTQSEFQDFITDRIHEQIDFNRTTIGMDLNRVLEHTELSSRVPKILTLRRSEIEWYSLLNHPELGEVDQEGSYIDLRPLWFTAYGFRILSAMDLGLRCTIDELVRVSVVLEKLRLVPQDSCTVDSKLYELFFTEISRPLNSYIVNLIVTNQYHL